MLPSYRPYLEDDDGEAEDIAFEPRSTSWLLYLRRHPKLGPHLRKTDLYRWARLSIIVQRDQRDNGNRVVDQTSYSSQAVLGLQGISRVDCPSTYHRKSPWYNRETTGGESRDDSVRTRATVKTTATPVPACFAKSAPGVSRHQDEKRPPRISWQRPSHTSPFRVESL